MNQNLGYNYSVIDETDLFRKYDFSSTISRDDDLKTCSVIEKIISEGNYFTNSPKYQTKENLFGRTENIWLKYRMSFLFSVFMYLGKEVRVKNMMAWSFMTNKDSEPNREKLWHDHWHPSDPSAKMMSGIYYLDIPDNDLDLRGTEMAPNGVESNNRIFVRPSYQNWLVYPSYIWHRPGIVDSEKFRFILAADVEYYE